MLELCLLKLRESKRKKHGLYKGQKTKKRKTNEKTACKRVGELGGGLRHPYKRLCDDSVSCIPLRPPYAVHTDIVVAAQSVFSTGSSVLSFNTDVL